MDENGNSGIIPRYCLNRFPLTALELNARREPYQQLNDGFCDNKRKNRISKTFEGATNSFEERSQRVTNYVYGTDFLGRRHFELPKI